MFTPATVQALYIQCLPDQAKQECVGRYSTSKNVPTKTSDDPTNPVNMWITGDSNTRGVIASSNSIAGLLFVNHIGEVSVLSSPSTTLDNSGMPMIIGHYGDKLNHIVPIGMNQKTAVASTLSFMPSDVLNTYGSIMDPTAANDKEVVESTEADGELVDKIISIPNYQESTTRAHMAIVPNVLPLPFNHGIEGPHSLDDDELHSRLVEMHPFYGEWLEAMAFQFNSYGGYSLQSKGSGIIINPKLLMKVPDTTRLEEEVSTAFETLPNSSSLAASVISDLEKVAASNFNGWLEQHRQTYKEAFEPISQLLNGQQVPTNTTPLQQNRNETSTTSIADQAAIQRTARATAVWKLMLATTKTDDATGATYLEYPTLSPSLILALKETSPSSALSSIVRSIQKLQSIRREDRDYLLQETNFPAACMNVTFAANTREANFRTTALDPEEGQINATFTVFNFLPPATETIEYRNNVTNNQQVMFEIANHEPASKRTKTAIGMYAAGRQDTYDDLRATLANIDCFLQWAIDGTNSGPVPDLIADIRETFDLLSRPGIKSYFRHWINHSYWLPHSLLNEVQNLLRARADFAASDTNVAMVTAGQELPTTELAIYTGTMSTIRGNLVEIMNNTSTNKYASMPFTYLLFRSKRETNQTGTDANNGSSNRTNNGSSSRTNNGNSNYGGNNNRNSQSNRSNQGNGSENSGTRGGGSSRNAGTGSQGSRHDRGFLIIAPGTTVTSHCVLANGKSLCLDWSGLGRSCPNPRCRFAHVTYPFMNNVPQDKATVEEFVNSTNGISFAPGISPSRGRRQTAGRSNSTNSRNEGNGANSQN